MTQPALPASYIWPLLPVNLNATPSGQVGSEAARFTYSVQDATAADLFAAWCILVQRYSRLEEFSVGVGASAGLHVVNVQVPATGAASEVSRELRAAYAQLAPANTFAPNPARVQQLGTGGIGFLAAGDGAHEAQRAAWDLDLLAVCTPSATGLVLQVFTHPARYRSVAASELVQRWARTAHALAANSDAPIAELPLLTPDEAAAQRALLRGPEVAAVPPAPHVEFAARATTTPDAIAVECDGVTWTYEKLEHRSNQIARWLLRQSYSSEPQRVLVSMEPCCEFLACLLAIFKLGYTHVPLDPAYPVARQKVIIEDTQPLLILTQGALEQQLAQLGARTVVADAKESEFDVESPSALDVVDVRDRVAYIIYTSGTTGRPKGVEITYANLAHYIDVARNMYGYKSTDIIPAMARSSFSITFFELLSPLVVGAKLLLLNRAQVLDTANMLRVLQTVTCIHASPALWRRLIAYIREQGLGPQAFGNLRHASSGGDMVPPDVLESMRGLFPSAELYVIYGSSEISCMGCTFRVDNRRSGRAHACWSRISEHDRSGVGRGPEPRARRHGGPGHFGGDGLARGYLNAPELTAQKFRTIDGERLYSIGDVGRWTAPVISSSWGAVTFKSSCVASASSRAKSKPCCAICQAFVTPWSTQLSWLMAIHD